MYDATHIRNACGVVVVTSYDLPSRLRPEFDSPYPRLFRGRVRLEPFLEKKYPVVGMTLLGFRLRFSSSRGAQ